MQGEIGLIALLLLGTAGIGAMLLGGDTDNATDDSTPQEPEPDATTEADTDTPADVGTPRPSLTDRLNFDGEQGRAADIPGTTASAVDFTWYRPSGGTYDAVMQNRPGGWTIPTFEDPAGGNDTFFGTDEPINNVMMGGEVDLPSTPFPGLIGGNDWLTGGWGNDWVRGMAGNDTLGGDSGDDWLNGGSGNDTLFGGDGQDHVQGSGGDDSIFLGFGEDTNIYAPVYIALFESGSAEGFKQALDWDDQGRLFIDNEDTFPEWDSIWLDMREEALAEDPDLVFGMVVNGVHVGTSDEAVTRYGFNDDLADQRLRYDNNGNDLIRGGARLTDEEGNVLRDSEGNFLHDPSLIDGDDTIIDTHGSNTIFGDLGDDILMAFDRDAYWSDDDGNGIPAYREPDFRELSPDTIFGGYGNDLIFVDSGDVVTLDPVLDNDVFADRLVVGTEFSAFNVDKDINYEAVEVTDFDPSEDQLVIMNYLKDSGTRPYEGELSFQATDDGTAVMFGTQTVVNLQGVSPEELVLDVNVVVDTETTPGESLVDAIFANFNAGG